jgi:hypothetical protein
VDCSEVSLLLSEYVDDDLDSAIKEIVDAHMASCTSCAAELRSLQGYLSAMAGMEKVGAPPDFLAAVHERLEQPSTLERLAKWFFYPLKIKLPMELAGIALATLLLIFAYQAPEQKAAKSLPGVSGGAGQPVLRTDEKGATLDKAAAGKPASPPRRIELALLLSAPRMPEYAATQRPLSAAPQTKGKLESGREHVREPVTRQPLASMKSASPAPIDSPQKDDSSILLESYRAYEMIKESVTGLGGTVLSTVSRPETDELKTIVVRIPALSYPRFLESLRQTGHLKSTAEEPAGIKEALEDNEALEIHIELIPPE